MGLYPATLTVSMDEPAVRLSETVRRVPNERGHSEDRRFMTIQVIRQDAIAEYVEDLGFASDFPGESFMILADPRPGGDTVGEVLDMAIRRRWRRPMAVESGIEPPDLVNNWRRASEETRKIRNRVSVFGSQFKKQRD